MMCGDPRRGLEDRSLAVSTHTMTVYECNSRGSHRKVLGEILSEWLLQLGRYSVYSRPDHDTPKDWEEYFFLLWRHSSGVSMFAHGFNLKFGHLLELQISATCKRRRSNCSHSPRASPLAHDSHKNLTPIDSYTITSSFTLLNHRRTLSSRRRHRDFLHVCFAWP